MVMKEFCDKCSKEIKETEERIEISVGDRMPRKTLTGSPMNFNLLTDILCRKCAQGWRLDLNAMDAGGE